MSTIYICDTLNLLSDYREIVYAKKNIDYHTIKHLTKNIDTVNFFDLFFSKYITILNNKTLEEIKNSTFIFVLKKISDYTPILISILHKYFEYKIKFVIIENSFIEKILDKNKDDFICQYFFFWFQKYNNNCIRKMFYVHN